MPIYGTYLINACAPCFFRLVLEQLDDNLRSSLLVKLMPIIILEFFKEFRDFGK